MDSSDLTRRGFIAMLGRAGAAVSVGGLAVACGEAPGHGPITGPDGMAAPGRVLPPPPGPLSGVTPFITPNEDFYLVGINPLFEPDFDAGSVETDWRLSMTGFDGAQSQLTYNDLRNARVVDFLYTFECIGNRLGGPLIGNALWKGTPLGDVLAPILPASRSGYSVMFRALDGFYSSVSIERCLSDDSFLAYEMNGELMPAAHGFPVRVVLPDLYGMKQPRWIDRIELVADPATTGYWEERGWASEVPIKTTSRIDLPPRQTALQGEPFLISGIGFGGARGVERVEISLDGGSNWVDAEMTEGGDEAQWAIWAYRWTSPIVGEHTLMVRATDGTGDPQVATSQSAFPDGAAGYHQVVVEVEA